MTTRIGSTDHDVRGCSLVRMSFDTERQGFVLESLKETDAGNGDVDQEWRELRFILADGGEHL